MYVYANVYNHVHASLCIDDCSVWRGLHCLSTHMVKTCSFVGLFALPPMSVYSCVLMLCGLVVVVVVSGSCCERLCVCVRSVV